MLCVEFNPIHIEHKAVIDGYIHFMLNLNLFTCSFLEINFLKSIQDTYLTAESQISQELVFIIILMQCHTVIAAN